MSSENHEAQPMENAPAENVPVENVPVENVPVENVAEEAVRRHFLQSVATQALTQAAQLYSTLKNKSPEFVKVSLEKAEDSAVPLVANLSQQPIVTKFISYSTPYFEALDEKVDYAYEEGRKKVIMVDEWKKAVNQNLLLPVQASLITPAQNLFLQCQEAILELSKKGKENLGSFEEYATLLKKRVGDSWDEKLVIPAKSLFESAEQEFQRLKEKGTQNAESLRDFLQSQRMKFEHLVQSLSVHQTQMLQIVQSRFREPAEAFYRWCYETYAQLFTTSIAGNVSFNEFLIGLRVRIGSLYNDRLEKPALILFESFTKLWTEQKLVKQE